MAVFQWQFDNGSKKKVRSLKRKYKTLVQDLKNITETMPNPTESSLGYWHLHLPFSQDYVDSKKTPNKMRRDIMQMLISRVNYLINIKTKEQIDYRIYSIISLPNLFDSQIVVLPDKSWFDGFFERDTKEQKWIPLSLERNIVSEWDLSVPKGMDILGIREEITDEDGEKFESEIWFVGELK